jgi:hypothetical protein
VANEPSGHPKENGRRVRNKVIGLRKAIGHHGKIVLHVRSRLARDKDKVQDRVHRNRARQWVAAVQVLADLVHRVALVLASRAIRAGVAVANKALALRVKATADQTQPRHQHHKGKARQLLLGRPQPRRAKVLQVLLRHQRRSHRVRDQHRI